MNLVRNKQILVRLINFVKTPVLLRKKLILIWFSIIVQNDCGMQKSAGL